MGTQQPKFFMPPHLVGVKPPPSTTDERTSDTITLADLREHIRREHDNTTWVATLRDLQQLENEIRAARASVR